MLTVEGVRNLLRQIVAQDLAASWRTARLGETKAYLHQSVHLGYIETLRAIIKKRLDD
jgi:hypothetical protein